jgi:sugar-specific transcriptional regulator TrmB/DNA-binding CsgD family transcriptional regulator
MLRELGLDALAERVYRALLDEPALGAELLAKRLGISETQLGDALDVLADLALLRMSREEPGQRRPVSMERGVELLLRRQELELEERRKSLEAQRAEAAALATASRNRGTRPTGVERLTGLDEIQSAMESLVQAATAETRSLVPSVPRAEELEASRTLDQELAERGITQHILQHEGVRTNALALAHGRWLAGIGAHIRTSLGLPLRLLIVDQTTAVVPFDPEDRGGGALLITAPGIVAALNGLFDRLWSAAIPLEVAPEPHAPGGITQAERELLLILANGATDEAAAKRLGVSLRTVKRRMEDLMRRLEAGSRFEAGLKAGKRGWL